MTHPHQQLIDLAWEGRAQLTAASAPDVASAVEAVIADLNAGRIRVAERQVLDRKEVAGERCVAEEPAQEEHPRPLPEQRQPLPPRGGHEDRGHHDAA